MSSDPRPQPIKDPFNVNVDAAVASFWMSVESEERVLEGRGVVITGAGRGLGRAYAIDAARAGARVIVNDVDRKPAEEVVTEIAALGGEAYLSAQDVADPEGAEALVALAVNSFGRLDGFVNNAGVYHEAAIWEEDPERVRRTIEVNLLGAVNCSIFAARAMGDGGSIVNASSGGMFGFPTTVTYGATKGGIAALTYGAALDLEERGIRVNAISPKAFTRLTADALGRHATPLGGEEAPLADIEQRLPETIAPLVTFLISDLAAGITGQFLRFDGQSLAIVPTAAFADHPSQWVESWSPASLAAAFDGPLGAALQPFGVERRVPGRRPAEGARSNGAASTDED
jgi:NAD(P)-dependent dehydrogenase (short-subunit alcohol dehydrogenase family)